MMRQQRMAEDEGHACLKGGGGIGEPFVAVLQVLIFKKGPALLVAIRRGSNMNQQYSYYLKGSTFAVSIIVSLLFSMPAGLVLLGAISSVMPANVHAQEESGTVLEEIVVSASRREESLQDAPAVINVLNANIIERLRINDLDSVTQMIPGLTLDGNHSDQQRIALRGAFSNDTVPGSGVAVGMYIDGVYFGRFAGMAPILFDIERIEVLRGPQGTLYGPNVVGGLIHIETRDPSTTEVEGSAYVTVGNFGRFDVGGRVSLPLIEDELGVSLTATSQNSDGWLRNLVTGRDLDADDAKSIRTKAFWTPNDRTEVEALFEYWKDDSFGDSRVFFPEFGTTDTDLFVYPSDPDRETYIVEDSTHDRDVWTGALDIDYELNENMTFTSITSYHRNESLSDNLPFLVSPNSTLMMDRVRQVESFTQELRLAGQTDRLVWQTGVYYLNDEDRRRECLLQLQDPSTAASFIFPPGSQTTCQDMTANTDSYSVFGQATFEVNDWLSLTGGLRYAYVEKDSFMNVTGDFGPGFAFSEDPTPWQAVNEDTWDRVTPKVTADLHWNNVGPFDHIMLYGTYAEGFKDGSFFSDVTVALSTGSFDSEVVKNYEGGFKTTFWGGRANLNATYFTTDFSNLQTTFLMGQQLILLSDDAESDGFEVGLALAPTDQLSLRFDYAYLDAKFVSGANIGNRLPRAPKNSYTARGNYNWSSGPWDFSFDASYAYQGPSFIDSENVEPPGIHALTKVSKLDLNFAIAYKNWELSIWGKNLLDDKIMVEGNNFTTFWALSPFEAFVNGEEMFGGRTDQPTTYGATLKYTY